MQVLFLKTVLSFFVGIPSRKINNAAGPSTDVRTEQNGSEAEGRGGSVQPTLVGTREGTVRLGKECLALLHSLLLASTNETF